jgi:hypothetical protein
MTCEGAAVGAAAGAQADINNNTTTNKLNTANFLRAFMISSEWKRNFSSRRDRDSHCPVQISDLSANWLCYNRCAHYHDAIHH